MRTLYLDELFALNLVIDYFLLLAAAKLCALPMRRGRFMLAAALGALWSALSLFPALSFLHTPVMHPVLAAAMTLLAFGPERRLWRCMLAFLGVSALFGGAVYAAGLYRGSWSRSGALVRLDMRVLAISFAVCWAVVSAIFSRSAGPPRGHICQVSVEYHGRTVCFRALEDTGNGLYDPMTGCTALVAEAAVLSPLFPAEEAKYLAADAIDAAVHIPGARLLPYAGVDGKRRLLMAFRPDSAAVDGERRTDLLIAAARDLGGDGSYQAIF